MNTIQKAAAVAVMAALALPMAAHAADDAGKFQLSYDVGAVTLSTGKWYPLSIQLAAGWRASRYWAVEAVALEPVLIEATNNHGTAGEYEFRHAEGARVLGYLPVSDTFEWMAGAGAMWTTQQELGGASGMPRKVEPGLFLSAMWRRSAHLSMGVSTSYFTNTGTSTLAFRSEWKF